VRDDVVADQVTGVDPDGQPLAAGDTVVVTYATDEPGGGVAPNGSAVTHAVDGGTVVDEVAGTTTVDGPAPSAIVTSTPAPVTTLPATPTATDSASGTSASQTTAPTTAPTTMRTTTSTTTTATSSADG
jgi:eukaryotic-like serine/threonine-protein kinase